ncbi:uncharacterized protein LOC127835887 [Dreissena polymorpha]|uniref:Uncharacterized protein n=1 Tax=Dreissena polymorpha TaxID=45954 RepID=A0A9D4RR65_DREPO|nr:uncharacterized protein LOC127835887 [Dreissena polymorpha]KAH3877934.1 hypothetical protein DPMN_001814 [Dreissena polymorpha]
MAHAQSWRNIWTTISPPTTARPYTRQSIFDSLRAVQEALIRKTANEPRHFDHFPVPEPVKPTVEMHHHARVNPNTNANPNINDKLPNRYSGVKTWNLGSSLHTGSRNLGVVSDNTRSVDKQKDNKFDAISNLKSQQADNSLNNPAEVNPTNFGVLEEAGMLGILPTISPNADVAGMDGVVAIYAMDHNQHAASPTRQTSTANVVPTSQVTAGRSSTTRRLRVLPNGSIVDFGIDGSTQMTDHARPTRLAPTITSASQHTMTSAAQPQSTSVSNAEPVRVSPVASVGQGHGEPISTSGLSIKIRYPEPTSSTKFPNPQSTHSSSTHNSPTHTSSMHSSSTHRSSTPNHSEPMPLAKPNDSDQNNLHESHHQNSYSSDDVVSSIMEDPRYFPRAKTLAGLEALEKPKTAFAFNLADLPANFSVHLPTPKTTTHKTDDDHYCNYDDDHYTYDDDNHDNNNTGADGKS